MADVIVRIRPDGTTQIEVEGVCGASCADLTKNLEARLGGAVNDTKKDEFYQSESDQVLKQGGS